MPDNEIKDTLEELVSLYNTPNFIEGDPISIPHQFSLKEDIEIAGFLVATISWGKRETIVKNGQKMVELLGDSPYDFVMSHTPRQLCYLEGFVHRTFNGNDYKYFIKALKHIYAVHGGMENIFKRHTTPDTLQPAIHHFKRIFFEIPHQKRATKHIGDPFEGSAAKKINMMLRWMVRKDNKGVDFGIWKSISPSILSCPLDVHSGKNAREWGLLKRKQNDAKAVTLLDAELRKYDKIDPAKYDFALFGYGINKQD